MHHKKRKAKKQRAGCLYCKPHKMNGVGKDSIPPNARRRMGLGTNRAKEV